MKRILHRLKQKVSPKDPPPPYQDEIHANEDERRTSYQQVTDDPPICEVIDLLANCTVTTKSDENQDSNVEYAEVEDMGLWHSTPLPNRHKSKISLTWVLKDNLETAKVLRDDRLKNKSGYLEKNCNQINESERFVTTYKTHVNRVVGRNEHYHNLRFRNACEEFNGRESCSDTSVGTEEYVRKKHRHRHRRKKKGAKFGYDIRDLDSFLSAATIDRPGNIPVVIAFPTTLYQTQKDCQRELTLPLGTVVNAVFKNQQWVYAQTPHGHEGYVLYSACLPLGILPNKTSVQKKTPCWESSTDIYPQPCGNLTDTEKEQLRGRTRSETRTKPRTQKILKTSCAEKDFDTLYLKTKSICSNIDRLHEKENLQVNYGVKRQTLLVVNSDYGGNVLNKTLTVHKGDVVTLVQGDGSETDVDSEWFYVRKKDGSEGFIPAVVAGHGYI